MTERELATIRTINNIKPIDGADKIECAIIDGWNVVIAKDSFRAGEKVVYCEIDSWIPTELAPFLSKGKEPKVYEGINGERLKTVKIRGQVSQGLVLPVPDEFKECKIGTDLTYQLKIVKFDISDKITHGMVKKGNFPEFFPKTGQDRIQNIFSKLIPKWEITEKLDGSSMTVYYQDEIVGVCSHNLELIEDDNNAFWKAAKKDKLIDKLRTFGKNLVLQGELVGEKIQNNRYKIKGQMFYLFDIYDIDYGRYLTPYERWVIVKKLEIRHVPIIEKGVIMQDTIEEILKNAERKSVLCDTSEQEGYVYKSMDGRTSFKAISNKYLLGE
jgi:RNA ligase (TIGR02306 family)